jgi:oligosaccharide repeat unit polymerase
VLLTAIYKKAGMSLNGKNVHPFALSIIIQFCIFSLPGVIVVSFLGYDSARYYGISESTRIYIGLWYVYSLLIYFTVFFILASVFRLKNYNRNISHPLSYDKHMVYVTILLFLSIIFLFTKLFFSRKAPIFYLLDGDYAGAYIARVDIQKYPQYYYIPYVSNVMSLLMIFQFYFIFYFYVFSTKKTFKLTCYILISFIIAVIECLYETQKAPIIFLMFGALFIIYLKKNKIIRIIAPLGIIVFFIILLQSTVSGTDLNEGFNSAADRFLLGQNQGFYHIINSITPDSKYWFTNFYFVERLGGTGARADVDVIPFLNYVTSLDIVNVNSYYLGEAWSMFGYYGLLISPVVVALSMFVFIKVLDVLIGVSASFFIPYAIYIIPEFRINQSFTYFLYGKDFVFRTILMLIIFIMVIALSSLFIKKKNGFSNASRN